jgi:peptidoglycan glycosyltransferase
VSSGFDWLIARERNLELLLLVSSAAFVLAGWSALERSVSGLPDDANRVIVQFLLTLAAGHLALRVLVPRASVAIYACASLLTAVGLLFAARLAPDLPEAQDLAVRQVNWITLGTVAMALSAAFSVRYGLLRRQRYTAAVLALGVLLVTGLFGTEVNGARLWLSLGGQLVQMTEIIKVLLVVFLAGYLADEAPVLSVQSVRLGSRTYSTLPRLAPLVVALGAAIGALALLRDLGSIAILLLFASATVYVATNRSRYVAAGVAVMLVAALLGYLAFEHAEVRIETWLDPNEDPGGAGFQSLQAMYAIQAGGITGEGPGMGEPASIPAASTDYIFAAVAEELGFAGALGLIAVYIVFLFASLRVALDAPDRFGRILASSIGLLIVIQAGVIIAGNLRIVPTTGITLPFVSYGGSSIVVNYILVGMLAGISHRSEREAAQA